MPYTCTQVIYSTRVSSWIHSEDLLCCKDISDNALNRNVVGELVSVFICLYFQMNSIFLGAGNYCPLAVEPVTL